MLIFLNRDIEKNFRKSTTLNSRIIDICEMSLNY